jgi:hemolysin activation/secretion protein
MRLFFHHGNDPLPRIRHLTMGGVGGLRGYPDSLPGGDRLLLGSVDFRYLLSEGIPHSVFFREGLDAVVFFDTGDAKAGPDDLALRDLKADAGAGISGSGVLSYFGVFVGQSLTDTDLDPRITVRIARDF